MLSSIPIHMVLKPFPVIIKRDNRVWQGLDTVHVGSFKYNYRMNLLWIAFKVSKMSTIKIDIGFDMSICLPFQMPFHVLLNINIITHKYVFNKMTTLIRIRTYMKVWQKCFWADAYFSHKKWLHKNNKNIFREKVCLIIALTL